jgi:hypothetical protein
VSDDDHADHEGGFLDFFSHFDWLHVPGMVRAIARVVAGTAQAGTAWIAAIEAKGQQATQRIRDDTEARKRIFAAVSKAAAQEAAKSPALIQRTIERLYGETVVQQENREAVATKAIELLAENPPDPQTPGPSEDWLNVFSSHAEKATSETLRQHWAHILAQEIRTPGSISLVTLLMLSIIDANVAEVVTRVRRWIAVDWIPTLGPLGVSPCYDDLLTLDSIGFLRLASSKAFRPRSADEPILTPYLRTGIWTFGQPGRTYQIPGGLLTIAGKEMLKIIPADEDRNMIDWITKDMRHLVGFDRVQVGPLRYENGIPVGLSDVTDVT